MTSYMKGHAGFPHGNLKPIAVFSSHRELRESHKTCLEFFDESTRSTVSGKLEA